MIKILTGIFIGLTISLISYHLTNSPLQQIYKGYNNLTMYEDGSYKAETINGQSEIGCINGALCAQD